MVQLESEGKGSTFSKASFIADESSDINIDDPDFWQKWAEKAKLDLDELANKVHVHVHVYMYMYVHMYMKTPIWSTLHHPKGTTQKGTTQG